MSLAAKIGDKAIDLLFHDETWQIFGLPGVPGNGMVSSMFTPAWKKELFERLRIEVVGAFLASFENISPRLRDDVNAAIMLICVDSKTVAGTDTRWDNQDLRDVVSRYAGNESRIESMFVRLGGIRGVPLKLRMKLQEGASAFDSLIYSDKSRAAALLLASNKQ